MKKEIELQVLDSKKKIVNSFSDFDDIFFLSAWGNIGDELIYEGTKALLSGNKYNEINLQNLKEEEGEVALISGSGGWTKHFHLLPGFMPKIARQFQRVIVFPSTYDIRDPLVKKIISEVHAFYFAREPVSFIQIKDLCEADIAHDCAFFYDYTKFYNREGKGVLNAFRTDMASVWNSLPDGNIDISTQCRSLEEWLTTITKYEIVRTDRAHVLIAAALLGKQVEYTSSFDHKVPAIADYALQGLPVYQIPDPFSSSFSKSKIFSTLRETSKPPVEMREYYEKSNIFRFASHIAERASAHPIVITDELSVDKAIGSLEKIVAVIPHGVKELSKKSRFGKKISEFVKNSYKTLLIDDLETPIDIHYAKQIVEENKLSFEFIGYTKNQKGETKVLSILADSVIKNELIVPENFRVIALIAIYNECDIIKESIEDLHKNGIDVYIIDNWSTDNTYELARTMLGKGVVGIERWLKNGPLNYYNWRGLLQRKEELGLELNADWFIHQDADEIRESPWPGINLRDAFWIVNQQEYNAVDFTVLNFYPIDDEYISGSSFKNYFDYFRFGEKPGHFLQVKAWKKTSIRVDLQSTGGHDVKFANKKIFPYNFLLRHYPFRSQEQGEKKVFIERKPRFKLERETEGWHTQYDDIKKDSRFTKSPKDLFIFNTEFYNNFLI